MPRLDAENSARLRKLVQDLEITRSEAAQELGRPTKWLANALYRKDARNKFLGILVNDAFLLLPLLKARQRLRGNHEATTMFARLSVMQRQRDDAAQAKDAVVPLLIFDDAIGTFADALHRYLDFRKIEGRPSKKVIAEFFRREVSPMVSFQARCATALQQKCVRQATTPNRIRFRSGIGKDWDDETCIAAFRFTVGVVRFDEPDPLAHSELPALSKTRPKISNLKAKAKK